VTENLNLKRVSVVEKGYNRSRVIQLEVQNDMAISKLAGADLPLSESEGYVLEVLSGRQQIVVTGKSTSGVFYGLQSLLSLLAASADGRSVPAVRYFVLSSSSLSSDLLTGSLTHKNKEIKTHYRHTTICNTTQKNITKT